MNEWLEACNIVAIRLDNIGDVLMLGPALRAVKESSPRARLTLLGTPGGTTAAPLLPWIDDVMVWRPVWQDVGGRIPLDPAREQAQVAELAARGFDAALVFTSFSQTPHVPGYVCYLAGIPLRAGESKEFGGSTLTTELQGAPDELHQVERNLRLVERLGFTVRDRRLVACIGDEARAAATRILCDLGLDVAAPYVVIHPGASAAARRYPAARFGAVADLLTRQGWQVLITGVEREAATVAEVAAWAPGARALVGATTLPEYGALVEGAAAVVCNNSLPLHLADALRTPLVALFSGTDLEEQWRPRDAPARLLRRPTPCQPCHLFTCPIGQPCLDVAPEEVVAAVAEVAAAQASRVPEVAGIVAGGPA